MGQESLELPVLLDKHETVAVRAQSGQDVVDQPMGSDAIIDKDAVWHGDTARCREVGDPTVLKRRGVDMEDRFGR